ncbi:hypothetical protein P7C73_g1792, partial [Tremellales sp. Uapishka_1]
MLSPDSRSQQRYFGSAPSFVNYIPSSGSGGDEEGQRRLGRNAGSDMDLAEHTEDEDATTPEEDLTPDEEQNPSADSPSMFLADPFKTSPGIAVADGVHSQPSGLPDPQKSGGRPSHVALPVSTSPISSSTVTTPRPGLLTLFNPVPIPPSTTTSTGTTSSGSDTPRVGKRGAHGGSRRSSYFGMGRSFTPSTSLEDSQRAEASHPAERVPRSEYSPSGESLRDEVPPLPNESTPLLRPSSSTLQPQTISPKAGPRRKASRRLSGIRRKSSAAVRRRSEIELGESTDGQTLFNAVAVLVGIGLLSLPLAFAYAGWIAGTVMLVGFAWTTCYTAKLLATLIFADRNMCGYTDLGRRAFGTGASISISLLFCLELYALGILPTALMPLRLLSLPSLLATLSSFLLIIIILVDGFSKSAAPGSLRHPEPTSWGPETSQANWLGGIGLVLAGFGGHAVIPSLARDMRNPQNFDKIINRAFVIATFISFIAGAAGYLMIGNTVSDEITRDLMQEKYHYSRALNLFATWMIVINPLTKFGLASRPLNVTIETVLGISPRFLRKPRKPSVHLSSSRSPSPAAATKVTPAIPNDSDISKSSERSSELRLYEQGLAREKRNSILRVLSRTVVTALCVGTAVILPGFGRVMAFLGSFSAFLICIILPLMFYLRLGPRLLDGGKRGSKWQHILHIGLLCVSMVLMIAGTVWAFIPGSGHGDVEE